MISINIMTRTLVVTNSIVVTRLCCVHWLVVTSIGSLGVTGMDRLMMRYMGSLMIRKISRLMMGKMRRLMIRSLDRLIDSRGSTSLV